MRQCTCGRSKMYPYCDGTHKNRAESADLNDISLQIDLANSSGKVLFLKGFMKESPDWKDFVGLIDHQYNNPLSTKSTEFIYNDSKNREHGPKFFLNHNGKSTNMYSMKNLDMHILFVKQINGVEHDWYSLPHLDEFLSIFGKKGIQNTAKCLINFAGNEFVGNIHSDKQDVVSWTCAGEIEYRIYKVYNKEPGTEIDMADGNRVEYEHNVNEYDSYIMQPGDVIYMPKGTFHQAVAHSPRASIILDYD
jgi:hypothetical protein